MESDLFVVIAKGKEGVSNEKKGKVFESIVMISEDLVTAVKAADRLFVGDYNNTQIDIASVIGPMTVGQFDCPEDDSQRVVYFKEKGKSGVWNDEKRKDNFEAHMGYVKLIADQFQSMSMKTVQEIGKILGIKYQSL